MQAPLIHRVSEKLCLGMYIVTYVLWGAGFWYFCIIWNYAYSPYYFFLPKARLLLDSSLPQPAPHPQSIALSGYSFGMPTALPAFIKPIFACVNFLYVCYRIFCFFFFFGALFDQLRILLDISLTSCHMRSLFSFLFCSPFCH